MSLQLRFTQDTWKLNISKERESKEITKHRCEAPWTWDDPVTGFRIQNSHTWNAKEAGDRISKTTRQRGLSKTARHKEGRPDRRLDNGTRFQLEDCRVLVSGAVSRGHTIMFWVFQEGQKKRLGMFHHKEMVLEEMYLSSLENYIMYMCIYTSYGIP